MHFCYESEKTVNGPICSRIVALYHRNSHIWPAEDGNTLVKGIKEYMNYYNNHRTHQSLDRKTPYDWYEFAA